MSKLDLQTARTIIAAALEKGRELALKPLSILVLDMGGHPIAFEREDGASIGRFTIAQGKAAGALFLGQSSRKISEMAAERPAFLASLGPIAAGGIVPAAGGLLILGSNQTIIGAIGVSGDTSDNDELAAAAGLAAAGYSH